ncbi:lamin tail domain-containing protein [bacterium]|nr:lamin tail domain-containing protein [bacterium]
MRISFKLVIFLLIFFNLIFFRFCLALKFNEIFPNPEGKDLNKEWIELYNDSSSSVDLYNHKIKDKAGKIFKIKDRYLIKQKEFFVIYPNPKLIINNQDEVLYLINPKGKILDKVVLKEKVPEEVSYCLIKNKWKFCPSTLGKENKKLLEESDRENANYIQDGISKGVNDSFDKSSKFFLFSTFISATFAYFLARKLHFFLPKH